MKNISDSQKNIINNQVKVKTALNGLIQAFEKIPEKIPGFIQAIEEYIKLQEKQKNEPTKQKKVEKKPEERSWIEYAQSWGEYANESLNNARKTLKDYDPIIQKAGIGNILGTGLSAVLTTGYYYDIQNNLNSKDKNNSKQTIISIIDTLCEQHKFTTNLISSLTTEESLKTVQELNLLKENKIYLPIIKELSSNKNFKSAIGAILEHQSFKIKDLSYKILEYTKITAPVIEKEKKLKILLESKINKSDKHNSETKSPFSENELLIISQTFNDYKKYNDFIKTNLEINDINSIKKQISRYKKQADTLTAPLESLVRNITNILLSPEVKSYIPNLITPELLNKIFELPSIKAISKEDPIIGNKIETYKKLASSLTSQKEFTNLVGHLTEDGIKLTNLTNKIMNLVYLDPKNKEESQIAAKELTSSIIDILSPEIIASSISLINEDLLKTILIPSNIAKTDEKEKISNNLKETAKIAQEIINSQDSKINIEQKNILRNIVSNVKKLFNNNDKPDNLEIIGQKEIAEKIRSFASQSKTIKDAIENNKTNIEKSLNYLIQTKIPPIGYALDNFCLSGEETTKILPKLLTEKGVNAIANYVEKPTIINLVRIFTSTNTLGFVIEHLVKSFIKNLSEYFKLNHAKETKIEEGKFKYEENPYITRKNSINKVKKEEVPISDNEKKTLDLRSDYYKKHFSKKPKLPSDLSHKR